jgi:hypothetical protein
MLRKLTVYDYRVFGKIKMHGLRCPKFVPFVSSDIRVCRVTPIGLERKGRD